MPTRPKFIISATNTPEESCTYPGSDEKLSYGRPIGKAAGLEKIGLHIERLEPGQRSSWPHAEEKEEEFVYVLEGQVDAWIDGHLHPMKKGDFAAFPAGSGICHSFLNNGYQEARLLCGGERSKPDNRIVYPCHPDRERTMKDGLWWKGAPLSPQGPHDGIAKASERAVVLPDDLERGFSELELDKTKCLLVHSSLSAFGYVIGGAKAVVDTLVDVTKAGVTICLPTHTATNTNPARWLNPPVPDAMWAQIKDSSPPFDPQTTPCDGMGAIPELFRSYPNVLRSNHPIGSFAACGPLAEKLCANEELRPLFGEGSTLKRLYELDAQILFLGTTHESNTSLHLSEHRSTCSKTIIQEGCAFIEQGVRVWRDFEMPSLETNDFAQLGEDFEAIHPSKQVTIGNAVVKRFSMRTMVDFGVEWMNSNRP